MLSNQNTLFCDVLNLEDLSKIPVLELAAGGNWFAVPGIALLSTCYAKSRNPDYGYTCMFTVMQSVKVNFIGLSLLYANSLVFDKNLNSIGSFHFT